MVLKLIGSLMVIAASSFLGFILSQDSSRRPQELRELQGMLQIFENEISFLSSVLTEAFVKVYKSSSSETAGFFYHTVKKLENSDSMSAAQAWETAVMENIAGTALNWEDKEILISFGRLLGNSDLKGQINNIRLTISQLGMQEKKAEENRKKNEVMYRSLGVLGGLAIVIILI